MSENRALLAALLEALDIPHPATVGDSETHDAILIERTMHAVTALRAVVLDVRTDIGWEADYLRSRLAEIPATGYRAHGSARGTVL